uniref:Carbohydrate ABC transporter permease n=1 Tax=candidate division WOR-3 bacterium TaxID=2052148 RepID=A0A7V3KP92_UNCW3
MRTKKFTLIDVIREILIIAALLVTIFPIVWMIITSIKPTNQILVSPPVFKFTPTFEHYLYAFNTADFALYIKNTLIVALSSTFIVVIVGTLASYSFARYDVGGGSLMFFILTTKMMPAIAVVLPFFLIFKATGNNPIGQFLQLGLDKLGTLVVCYTIFNLPFAIWLMHSFFQDVPRELEDSARLDGYSRFQTFYKIALRLAMPGIIVTAIFCLLFSWNEFLFASILTRSAARTITVGVGDFWTTNGILWGPLSAAASICIIPMIIFALVLQRWMVRGLTFGAVRG